MKENCSFDPVKKIWSGKTREQIYNIDANLGYLYLQKLIQNPTSIFQISYESGIVLNNADIYERSIKFASFFNKIGLKQGDIVGLIASNSENIASIMLGCLTQGIAINPLSIVMDESDITRMWSKLKPKVIFSDANIIKMVKNAVEKMALDAKIYSMINKADGFPFVDDILVEEVDVENYEFPDLPNISSTIAFISCSSGTTDSSKAICTPHKKIISQSFLTFKQNLKESDIIFNSSQSYWTIHQICLTYGILYNMTSIITTEKLTPELWMNIVERYKVTYFFFTPMFAAMVLRSKKVRKLESVLQITLSGSVFSEKLFEELTEIFPNAKILSGYGLTEANYLAMSDHQEGTIGVSSGYPFYNIQMKIIDDNGQALGPNQAGEIYFKTPVPFSGYFGDPERYAECFDSDNFVKSGDLGYFDDSGRVFIIDRMKHLIKSVGSQKVTPMEVENIVNEIDGVLHCAVVGVLDEEIFHDKIYAFVIKDQKRVDLNEEFIINYVNGKATEAKKISGGVIFIDKFPATASGKILYRELKKLAAKYNEQEKLEIAK